jgi:hypothetical protein
MQSTQSVIIILLVANLVATIWFGLQEKPALVQSNIEQAATHELPPLISSEERQKLYDQFVSAFNAADYDAIYEMFGASAKAQVTRESLEVELTKLNKWFHSVESGGFTHSEFAGSQGSVIYYQLYYAVKLSEDSTFGPSGTLTVTVAVQGNEYQVYGFGLDSG